MVTELKKLPLRYNYSEFITSLSKTNYYLGKLDAIFTKVRNADVFIKPLYIREATLSSQIEGIHSSIYDVYLYNTSEQTKYDDVKDIINYCKALEYTQKTLKYNHIDLGYIKNIYHILIHGNTDFNKYNDDFRKIQNWIGLPRTTIKDALYIPPSPKQVISLMKNLEKYINYTREDIIVQSALIHSQFECIHPFIDGNGRIGRILIPAFLYSRKIISYPIICISEYFEKHRRYYYHVLNNITKKNDTVSWIKFYIDSIYYGSIKTQDIIFKLSLLYNKIKWQIINYKSPYSIQFLDFIFKNPIFVSRKVGNDLQLNKVTVNRLIKMFINLKILKSMNRKRDNLYIFKELLTIIQS
jgi:Fic family protein